MTSESQHELAEQFRELFGDLIIKGRDGDWANVADFIATGARIPKCDAFYPHHTDTRCAKPKGHRGSHVAPWGGRDMAWPRDRRETPTEPIRGFIPGDESEISTTGWTA